VSVLDTFYEFRVALLELEILMYAVAIAMTLVGVILYNIAKYLIPYVFWKIDPDFISALYVYEKKELKSHINALIALVFILIIMVASVLGLVIYLIKKGM